MFENHPIHIVITLCVISLVIQSTNWRSSFAKHGCRGTTLPRLDPSSCHSFFQCIIGVQFRARCSPGTVFSKFTKKCENSAKIPCTANKSTGHVLEGTRCSVNGEIRPSELQCDKFLLCRVKYYIAMTCPFGLIFSNIKYRCIPAPDKCLTEAEVANSHTSLKEVEIKKDENPYIGICDNKINETVAEPFDCSMYILCEEDKSEIDKVQVAMSILECPNGTLFSTQQNKCIFPLDVFCGERYRMVNLYGMDAKRPANVGRAIGRSIATNQKRQEKPMHWVQPGKYRAISKPSTNSTMVHNNSNKLNSSGVDTEHRIITTTINGLTIQKPLRTELPTPIEPENVSTLQPEEAGGGANGRTFNKSPGNNSNLNRNESIANPEIAGSNKFISITSTSDESHNDRLTEYNIEHRVLYHEQPTIVKIIMGDEHTSSTTTLILNHTHRDAEAHTLIHNSHDECQGVHCSNRRDNGTDENLKEHSTRRVISEKSKTHRPIKYHYAIEHVQHYSDSLESDEEKRIRFNKSSRVGGVKRKNILEDYHALANGKRFNSTSDDIVYYGEDEYYFSNSEENETTTLVKLRKMDSLELTHHNNSNFGTKKKLPQT